ncbi:DMSO/Nitrate reductase chaperone [Acididesulfobacillus acetoxydans]|uniref:DMSO/Nitrate reductase chaperone n=1 Tax=Acididesulfobacillus acetoxydans TaxID=1561005 RepID=A0A8S0X5B0_9FIRM|nr:hypothetical protein [Acididesulfobacillus acetoxydans]CAA7601470.1 DMSO/Nitrate reductase chaperone [Acididesulfobacillus acetoxydans]CEJ06125.1 DMSO/Nitrate reductase chaperone [Acididesulfobacillus acetoxydans]
MLSRINRTSFSGEQPLLESFTAELQPEFARQEIELWSGRRLLYGLAAVFLGRPPAEEWLAQVFSPSFIVVVENLGLSRNLSDGLKQVLGIVQDPAELPQFLADAQTEYERLFRVPLKGTMVPLGAGAYLPREADLNRRRVIVEGWYARFAFDWREYLVGTPGVWPNEPEHALLLLTFLAILADEVVTGLSEGDGLAPDLMALWHEVLSLTQEWLPACMARVADRSQNLYFRSLARLTGEVLARDGGELPRKS